MGVRPSWPTRRAGWWRSAATRRRRGRRWPGTSSTTASRWPMRRSASGPATRSASSAGWPPRRARPRRSASPGRSGGRSAWPPRSRRPRRSRPTTRTSSCPRRAGPTWSCSASWTGPTATTLRDELCDAHARRLARAVRPGGDRVAGLRHACRRAAAWAACPRSSATASTASSATTSTSSCGACRKWRPWTGRRSAPSVLDRFSPQRMADGYEAVYAARLALAAAR